MSMTPNYANRTIVPNELETFLVNYVKDRIRALSGMTVLEFRQKVFQVCEKNNLKMPESWIKERIAGKLRTTA